MKVCVAFFGITRSLSHIKDSIFEMSFLRFLPFLKLSLLHNFLKPPLMKRQIVDWSKMNSFPFHDIKQIRLVI